MFTVSVGQTEDVHAMKMHDTFNTLQDLSHAVRGRNTTVNTCAPTSRVMCACHQRPVGQCEVDCEGAVRSCRSSGCGQVLSDGSWAGLPCTVSSLAPIFLLKIHFAPLRRRELLVNHGKLILFETFVLSS